MNRLDTDHTTIYRVPRRVCPFREHDSCGRYGSFVGIDPSQRPSSGCERFSTDGVETRATQTLSRQNYNFWNVLEDFQEVGFEEAVF